MSGCTQTEGHPRSPRLIYRPEALTPHPDEIFDGAFARVDDGIDALADARENALLAIAERETGTCVPPAAAAKAETQDTELLRQSRVIRERARIGYEHLAAAALLEARTHRGADRRREMREAALQWRRFHGRDLMRRSTFELYRVFLHSGHVIQMPQFRRSTLLPSVAKQVRQPMLSAVEEFLYYDPYVRMWTITSGVRCPLGPIGARLRQRIRAFHRKLNRLCRFILREHGIEMIFRSTELGGIETDADGRPIGGAGELEIDPRTGEPTFHVHAHCLVRSTIGYRNAHRWESMLRSVHAFWGHRWADNGIVRNGREVVKYITKPGEMCRLRPDRLAELAEALRGLRLVSPLGSLKRQIAAMHERAERVDWQPTPEGRVPVRVPDWNRHGKSTDLDRQIDRMRAMDNGENREPDFRVVARLAPAFAPGSCMKEPVVCILGTRLPRLEDIRRHPLVRRLYAATAGEWAAGAAIKVHTCTSTGLSPVPFGATSPPEIGVEAEK